MGRIELDQKAIVDMNSQAPDFANLPVATATNINTWNPGNYDGDGWRMVAGSNVTMKGLVPPASGEQKTYWLINTTNNRTIELAHNDGAAVLGGRFICPNNQYYRIRKNATLLITYDTTINAWRVLGDGRH